MLCVAQHVPPKNDDRGDQKFKEGIGTVNHDRCRVVRLATIEGQRGEVLRAGEYRLQKRVQAVWEGGYKN